MALVDLLLHLLPLYIQMFSVLWSEVIINIPPVWLVTSHGKLVSGFRERLSRTIMFLIHFRK